MWHSETSIPVLGASALRGACHWQHGAFRSVCSRHSPAKAGGSGECRVHARTRLSALLELPYPDLEAQVSFETCLCCWSWAAGASGSSCLLKQVLDYRGKVRNLFKFFCLTYFIQSSEDLSSSWTLMDAAVQPQCQLIYSYTHENHSGVQVLSLITEMICIRAESVTLAAWCSVVV